METKSDVDPCSAANCSSPGSPTTRPGRTPPSALSAFPGMTPQQKGTHTVLTGWLDQSALYGVLAELEALGLALLEVRQMEPHGKSLESGDTRSP